MKLNDYDIHCSRICTRAGISILLFSVLAFSILLPLKSADIFNALAKYVTLRYELKYTIDDLDNESCWRYAKRNHRFPFNEEEISLGKLKEYECEQPLPLIKEEKNSPQKAIPQLDPEGKIKAPLTKEKIPPELKLQPPSNLRVSGKVSQIETIFNILKTLGDKDMLNKARSFSIGYGYSIFRWEQQLERLIWTDHPEMVVIRRTSAERTKEKAGNIVSLFQDYLNLKKVRELSTIEYPNMTEFELIFKETSKVNMPSLGIPINLVFATYIIESAILFSLLYFWLFFMQAKMSKTYLSNGTLWGAFNKTKFTRFLFLAILLLPCISSSLLATETFQYTYVNIGLSVLIIGFSISISTNFQKRNIEKHILT